MELRKPSGWSDLPLFAAARPRPVESPAPVNPRSGGMEALGDEALAIWSVLDRDCRGMARGCTAATIGLRAGLWSDKSAGDRGRNVRRVIAAHVDDFPEVVVATPGSGYYVAECPEDLEAAHRCLRSHQMETWQRELAITRAGKARGWTYLGKGRWKR